MGSWAQLNIRGHDVFHWKSEVDPTFLFLFTVNEVDGVPPRSDVDDESFDDDVRLVLRSTVGVLADRLDTLGVAAADLDACLALGVADRLESLQDMAESPWGARGHDPAIGVLREMTFSGWAERVRQALSEPESYLEPSFDDYTKLQPLMELWEGIESRWLLRALLEACEPGDAVELDLTHLAMGGYLEQFGFDPQAAATAMFSYAIANGTPAIVVTEGRTDVEFLRAAIEIRRPHLVSFIKFFEHGSVHAGAPAAINTAKAFAAAGINNRVIVLLDNDATGHDALRVGRKARLPANYEITHFPYLELARDYPSKGPTGRQSGDINGQAASIEIYLGTDVLTDPVTGELRPVVWGGRNDALDRYQGEVEGKTRIDHAFRDKVAAAKEDPATIANQDWSGLDAVLDELVRVLATCAVPSMDQREGFVR